MSFVEAERRIAALLAGAARLRDPDDVLGREARLRLPAATGLDHTNVELALTAHVETTAEPSLFSDFAREDERRAPIVHVVLSAGVFVSALRAVCLAAIRGERVVVVPSSREDPVFLRLLLEASGADFVQIAPQMDAREHDEVHAYGRDETLRSIREALPSGIGFWGHGAGVGLVAAVSGRAVDPELLADDIVVFDQRGCLSPKLVLVRSGGQALAADLAATLERRLDEVPLGDCSDAERASAAAFRSTLEALGSCYGRTGALVGFSEEARDLYLPTSPRSVHIVESARLWPRLDDVGHVFTCVAGDDDEAKAVLPLARRARLGQMQRPPLDGPVDQRASAPLPVVTTTQMAK